MSIERIAEIHSKLEKSIFTVKPTHAYSSLASVFVKLCDLLNNDDISAEEWACIGEYSYCCLSDMLVGAYWHYIDWHGGQSSESYLALCAIGSIYEPNMQDGCEPDSCEMDCYNMLDQLASEA